MNIDQIREIGLSLPGTTEQVQWDDDLVFKVGKKMFLVAGLEPGLGYSFKCSDEKFYELTELPGIRPAPYLARAKWVRIQPDECRLGRAEIEQLIRQSFDLVVSRLPKKVQREIANLSSEA